MTGTMFAALAAVLKYLALFGFVMTLAGLLTWAERRQSGMIQDRLGPNRANLGRFRFWGLAHFVADAIKMIFKEDVVPAGSNRFLFGLAPILAITPVLCAFAIIPFGPPVHLGALGRVLAPETAAAGEPLQVFQIEFGLLFYIAFAGLSSYGITLAGWASYNKLGLMGALRAASQLLSYEVALAVSLLGSFLVMGTLEPGAMVRWQGTNPLRWGIVVQPIGFLLYLVAAFAETKRVPFDLPEGEPEIIGYFVEYSGLRFGMFYLAEFIEVVFAACLMTTVFLGGWQLPGLHADGWHLLGWSWAWPHGLVVLAQLLAFTAKVVFLAWFQLMIRWTLPRFRPDQLMKLGWQKLLPVGLVNLMLTAAVLLALGA